MDTYAELVSAVEAFIHGSDIDPRVSTQVPVFIDLGEAAVYRNLRDHRMIQNVNLDYENPPYLMPSDYLEADSMHVGYTEVNFVLKEAILQNEVTEDVPTWWSIHGQEFIFNGTPTDTTILTYYARPAALATEVNDIFLLNSDLFLYAALREAMVFMRDEERMAIWAANFQQRLQEAQLAAWAQSAPRGQPVRSQGRVDTATATT